MVPPFSRFLTISLSTVVFLIIPPLIICQESSSSSSTVQVTIEQGQLAGTTLSSRNGNEFYAFHSIPYAKPPVGSLRFQPPRQPEKWSGVRNVAKYPPACIQTDYFIHEEGISGEEDCLYLNVFTRELGGKAPVLVYIHGGGYMAGTGSLYSPTYIMDHTCVLLVTINYRLGILGYLSAGDDELPGNIGMKDQVAALKWVQKNIAAFGGDPANVLIFGQSAGGASVHLHLFSALSKGLFHKAISLSGSALNTWAVSPLDMAKQNFKTVSLLSGCLFHNTSDVVQCLKTVPAEDLVKTQLKLQVQGIDPACALGPVVESDTVSDRFLAKLPQRGEELNTEIPWIVGQTSAEAMLLVDEYLKKPDGLKYYNDNYRRLLPITTMSRPWIPSEFETVTSFSEDLKRIYLHDNEDIDLKTIKPFTILLSDAIMTFGLAESASEYKGRRYLYYIDYKRRSGPKFPYDDRLTSIGVYHAEELNHFFNFGNLLKNEKDIDSQDYEVSEYLIKMLIGFAYTGDPNINELTNFKWNPVNENLGPYLHINNSGQFETGTNFFKEKYEIWTKHISKYLQR